MKFKLNPMGGNRGGVGRDPIYISGEITSDHDAAEKLGMKPDTFAKRRRAVVAKLGPGEGLTWDHFKKRPRKGVS